MRNPIIAAFAVAALLLALTAQAHRPTPTTSADPQTQSLAYLSDRPIWDVERLGDWMYVGGEFGFLGPISAGMVGYDPFADRLLPLSQLIPNYGEIAVVDDGDGGWFFGGNSIEAITESAPLQLLQLDADGQIDASWGQGIPGPVVSLARDETTLYVGGWYRLPSGDFGGGYLQAIRLADRQLLYQRTDLPSEPESLALHSTVIYLGGNGGPPWLRAFDRATGQPLPWAPQFPTVYSLLAKLVATDDRLYVVGGFTHVNSQARYGLAAFALPSGELLDWAPSVTPGSFFNQLQLANDTLYVGGSFTTLAGMPRSRVAAFNASTGALTPFTLPTELQNDPALEPGFTAFADRLFTIRETAFRDPSEPWARVYQLIEVDRTNGQTSLGPVVYGGDGPIGLLRSDTAMFVVDHWDHSLVSASPAHNQRLARLDPATSALSDWSPPTDIGVVRAIAANGDRLLISDGYRLRALDPERNVWESWTAQIRPSDSQLPRYLPMHVIGNTLIYPGVDLVSPDAGYGLMAVDLTTGAVRRWSQPFPLFTNHEEVTSMVEVDGRLYVGGVFEATAPGSPTKSLAGLIALDLATGALHDWSPPLPESPYGFYVGGMAFSDGLLHIAGLFPESDGSVLRGLRAIDLASGQLSPWYGQGCAECDRVAVTDQYVLGRVTSQGSETLSAIRVFDRSTGAMLDWSVLINDSGCSSHNEDSLGMLLDDRRLYIFGCWVGVGIDKGASLLILPAPGVAPVPTATPTATATPSPTAGPTQAPYRIHLPMMTGQG